MPVVHQIIDGKPIATRADLPRSKSGGPKKEPIDWTWLQCSPHDVAKALLIAHKGADAENTAAVHFAGVGWILQGTIITHAEAADHAQSHGRRDSTIKLWVHKWLQEGRPIAEDLKLPYAAAEVISTVSVASARAAGRIKEQTKEEVEEFVANRKTRAKDELAKILNDPNIRAKGITIDTWESMLYELQKVTFNGITGTNKMSHDDGIDIAGVFHPFDGVISKRQDVITAGLFRLLEHHNVLTPDLIDMWVASAKATFIKGQERTRKQAGVPRKKKSGSAPPKAYTPATFKVFKQNYKNRQKAALQAIDEEFVAAGHDALDVEDASVVVKAHLDYR